MKTMITKSKTTMLYVTLRRTLLGGLAALTLTAACLPPRTAQADGLYLPDLKITRVDYNYVNGTVDPNFMRVYFFNQGTANSKTCKLALRKWNGTPKYDLVATYTASAQHPGHGSYVLVPKTTHIADEGYVFKLTIDDENVVQEFLENNNDYYQNNL